MLAGLLRQKHLTVAHIVEEQAGGRLLHGALGGQNPVRHVVDGESAQPLGNGEHLGAEELLEHLGRRLELRGAALVGRLVEVVEPDGIAAPQGVGLLAEQVLRHMPGQRGRRGVDIAIGEIIGTPPIVKQHFGDTERQRAAAKCRLPGSQQFIHGKTPLDRFVEKIPYVALLQCTTF